MKDWKGKLKNWADRIRAKLPRRKGASGETPAARGEPTQLPDADTAPILATRRARVRAAFAKVRQKLTDLRSNGSLQIPGNLKDRLPLNMKALAATVEKGRELLQGQNVALYGKIATLLASTYFLADLSTLVVEEMIPEPPVVRTDNRPSAGGRATVNDYNAIFSRNLFNSKGLIPGEGEPTDTPVEDPNAPAVKTSLPLRLVGTLILTDERRSIGTIADTSNGKIYPVQVDDQVPGKIRVTQVEPRRVTFVNLSNGKREYVDLPEDLSAPRPTFTSARGAPTPAKGIQETARNQYTISRTRIDEAMKDLNRVLTQARAVPHFENGVNAGFKLFQIVPGSIYDELGFRNGDVIAGINGEPLNDPSKAIQMLQGLKDTNHVEITVKRNGRESTKVYDIQ